MMHTCFQTKITIATRISDMGAGKEMWIAAYEQACENFIDGVWGEDEFRLELKSLGHDPEETEDHLAALKDEMV